MTPSPSIGTHNESMLHAALKAWAARPGDRIEAVVGPYVVDIDQGERLVEIQIQNLGAIREKLLALGAAHRVRVIIPLFAETLLVTQAPDGAILSKRRSPRKSTWGNLFDVLVHTPTLIEHPNLEILALLVAIEEHRCADGQGSWRRKGVSIVDRRLLRVREERLFCTGQDLARLLPPDLPAPFTHRELAAAMGVRLATAQRASYCLRKLGLLRIAGRRNRAMLVEPTTRG